MRARVAPEASLPSLRSMESVLGHTLETGLDLRVRSNVLSCRATYLVRRFRSRHLSRARRTGECYARASRLALSPTRSLRSLDCRATSLPLRHPASRPASCLCCPDTTTGSYGVRLELSAPRRSESGARLWNGDDSALPRHHRARSTSAGRIRRDESSRALDTN